MLMWIEKGGMVMYPIILGSIIALAIFLERLWVLRAHHVAPLDFFQKINGLIREKRFNEALATCGENHSSLAQVAEVIIKNENKPRDRIVEAAETEGKIEITILNRNMGALAIIATIEPLLGLLGTVTGLIAAFQSIENAGVIGDPRIVAAGVWEALITTAAGLIIAIPAVLAHRYLKSRITHLTLQLETLSFELIESVVTANEPQATQENPQPFSSGANEC